MTNINYKEVGNRLKRLIAEKNMNQIEFAKLCNVSEASLRLHIRGEIKKGINCDCLYAYSRELNVSMEYLLTGVETKKPIAIKYVDIINAINLLIDAFGTEIISPCSEEFADCLYIADEAIQTYLEKIRLNGHIREDLERINEGETYNKMRREWAGLSCNRYSHTTKKIIPYDDDDDNLPF